MELSILHDIADGMAFLHSLTPEMMHNDLKSDNVLIFDSLQNSFSPASTFWPRYATSDWLPAPECPTRGLSMGPKSREHAFLPCARRDDRDTYDEVKLRVYSFAITLLEVITGLKP